MGATTCSPSAEGTGARRRAATRTRRRSLVPWAGRLQGRPLGARRAGRGSGGSPSGPGRGLEGSLPRPSASQSGAVDRRRPAPMTRGAAPVLNHLPRRELHARGRSRHPVCVARLFRRGRTLSERSMIALADMIVPWPEDHVAGRTDPDVRLSVAAARAPRATPTAVRHAAAATNARRVRPGQAYGPSPPCSFLVVTAEMPRNASSRRRKRRPRRRAPVLTTASAAIRAADKPSPALLRAAPPAPSARARRLAESRAKARSPTAAGEVEVVAGGDDQAASWKRRARLPMVRPAPGASSRRRRLRTGGRSARSRPRRTDRRLGGRLHVAIVVHP